MAGNIMTFAYIFGLTTGAAVSYKLHNLVNDYSSSSSPSAIQYVHNRTMILAHSDSFGYNCHNSTIMMMTKIMNNDKNNHINSNNINNVSYSWPGQQTNSHQYQVKNSMITPSPPPPPSTPALTTILYPRVIIPNNVSTIASTTATTMLLNKTIANVMNNVTTIATPATIINKFVTIATVNNL